MRRLSAFLFLINLVASHLAAAQEARVIGFDHPYFPSNGTGMSLRPTLTEQGMVLGAAPDDTFTSMYIQPALGPGSPDNGTHYARFLAGDRLSVRHRDGLPFTAKKVDLAHHAGRVLAFEGKKQDGSTVSVVFELEGIGDGTGPAADFETFTFPNTFVSLVELKGPNTALHLSYYLDNLEVIVEGAETSPPTLDPPLLYDIDWNDVPHLLNKPTRTGEQRAPSSSIFGTQYVRAKIGGLQDQPLELGGQESSYDQFGLSLPPGAGRYVLEFDTTQTTSASSLAVIFDYVSGFVRTDFDGDGSISVLSHPAVTALHNAQGVNHFRMTFDRKSRQMQVEMNGSALFSVHLPPSGSLDATNVRFNTTGPAVVGLDNVRLSVVDPSPLLVIPRTINFLHMNVGAQRSMPLRLLNTGTTPLTITGATPEDAAFSLAGGVSFPAIIQPNEMAVFELIAHPQIAGHSSGSISFETSDGQSAFVSAQVIGDGPPDPPPPPPPPPTFVSHPLSQIIQERHPLLLLASVSGPSVTGVYWTKDGEIIPGANDIRLAIVPTNTSHAGFYGAHAILGDGSIISSRRANIAIATPRSLNSAVLVGDKVEMAATVVGSLLRYEWDSYRGLTRDDPAIQVSGPQLTIFPVATRHQDTYYARVYLSDESTTDAASAVILDHRVTVRQLPSITTTALPHWRVGQPGSMALQASGQPTSFSAIGLPPGLTINTTTGAISGLPLPEAAPEGKPVRYVVKVRAANNWGTGPEMTLDCWVHPLTPVAATTTFIGVIAPGEMTADSRKLGGLIRFTLSPTGSLTATGSFVVGTVSTGVGSLQFRPADGARTGVLYFTRPFPQQIRVRLTADQRFESEDVGGQADGVISALPVLRKPGANHPLGLYPTALVVQDDATAPHTGNSGAVPEGAGFMLVRITAGGQMTYTGKVADGHIITGSTSLVADGAEKMRGPVFSFAPAGRGSLVGWLTCGAGLIDGHLKWQKMASDYETSYRRGFADVIVQAVGEFQPSTQSHCLKMGLGGSSTSLTFSGSGLEEEIERGFNISPSHRATPSGHSAATLALQPAGGTFSGSVNVGTYRGMPVRGNFQGVLVPRLGMGVGFCLTPDISLFRSYAGPRVYRSALVELRSEGL